MFVAHLYYVLSIEIVLFQDLFITFLLKKYIYNKYIYNITFLKIISKNEKKKNGAHERLPVSPRLPPRILSSGWMIFGLGVYQHVFTNEKPIDQTAFERRVLSLRARNRRLVIGITYDLQWPARR